VSVAIVLVQIPALRAALGPVPSLHDGAGAVDSETEACIDTLWRISSLVQQGEPAEAIAHMPFREPVTHAPYVVAMEDGVVVVACPNPGAHDLRRLRITAAAPMPEALR
jgi:hypothetical protein